MLQKLLFTGLINVALLLVASISFADPIYINQGESTGWQHFSAKFEAGTPDMSGYVYFGLGKQTDSVENAYLLLDRVKIRDSNGTSIPILNSNTIGFESSGNLPSGGNFIKVFSPFAGFAPYDNGMGLLSTDTTYSLTSLLGPYVNSTGLTGSYLALPVILKAGYTFSFDWNFISNNSNAGSGLLFLDSRGSEYNHFETLAIMNHQQSEPVPEPSTFLLFGVGLIGVGIMRRKFKK